jgi:hypothetical protein
MSRRLRAKGAEEIMIERTNEGNWKGIRGRERRRQMYGNFYNKHRNLPLNFQRSLHEK